MTTTLGELIPISTLACEDEADEAIQLMDQRHIVSTVESIGEIRAADGSEPTRTVFLLKVAPEQADVAREILRSVGLLHQDGQGWHCTTCGTSVERSYLACWSCGTPRDGAVSFDLPVVGAASGGSCSTGGCGSGCGCGPTVVDVEIPAELLSVIEENDRLAKRACVTAAISLLMPPVAVASTWLIGKTLVRPLSSQGTQQFYTAIAMTFVSIVEAGVLWNMFGASWLRS